MEEHVKIIFFAYITLSWRWNRQYVEGLSCNYTTILEYAVPCILAGYIPEYLSYKIESVQRRALKMINPGEEIMTNF
jgi:hypothetical protein